MTADNWNYFVVMKDLGKRGREATVDPEMTWRGALDLVHEAASDGQGVCFVHEIRDGVVEDRTEEAIDAVTQDLAEGGDPISYHQREFIEAHRGVQFANAYRMEDA